MSDLYKLGDYVVDGLRRQIRLDDTVIPMQQKPFEVLLLLIARSGRVVSKDELMQEVWPDSFVEEANLTQSIFLLRKAFSDKAAGSRYIVTVPGRGYQLGVEPIAIDTAAQRPEIESVVASASPALGDAGKAPRPPAKLRTPMLRVMAVVAAAGLLLVGLLIWRSLHPAPFSHFSVRRLTNSGDVKLTAISRTGRYLAMVTRSSAGRESLSVTDLHGGNAHVILSPEGAVFKDVEVSPDDAYVYYRSHAEGSSLGTFSVSRIPLLGGEPTLVVNDVDGPVSFLDGGARLCFWRGNGENQFAILSVEADSGKDEKTLAGNLQMMPSEVVCSPDGQRAAISREVGGIVLLDLKTGRIKPFYSSSQGDEFYMDMSWKSDGSGLLTSVVSPFNLYPSLIFISYPGGKRTRITNELSSYSSAGVTEDGSAIVALQRDKNAQFQSFDLPLLALNPAVSPDVISFAWTDFLGWHNDDQIVGSTAAGGLKMKTVADSQERFVQTAHGVQFLQPNGCGTAALVAAGGRPPDKAISIWHMNADGSQLKQISAGPEDILPVCSVDGKWVFYADNSSRGKASVYRIAAEGGTPLKYETGTVWFAVSHSGEKLAWISGSGGQQKLMLADTASGKSLASKTLPATLRAARSLTFGPDDQHIFFTVTGETSDSVFEMPVGEMPVGDPVAALSKNDEQVPVKRIEFRAAHLATIMVSPGGKHLGVVTVKPTADAVMLEDRR